MKNLIRILIVALGCAATLAAQAKLNVVTTLPDLGALAREIGGDKVEVTTLAKATEDPHFVDARPSFVVQLRNADVLIDGGAELEIGWLPPLLQNARNPKLEAMVAYAQMAMHDEYQRSGTKQRLVDVSATPRRAGRTSGAGSRGWNGAIKGPHRASW